MISNKLKQNERPIFPKKAVITAGMPYGNKKLHFGHIGGMFVHADVYARFLRDRIGKENVIFLSGTDCYGSLILESYKNLKEEGYSGTIEDYVRENHYSQKETLDKFQISLDFFGASALDESAKIHQEVSNIIFNDLYEQGYIKQYTTPQFYDEEKQVYLNGRQVIGKCPIAGCTSEHAYADECSLGHQYMPSELINPISILSNQTPSYKNVTNWYFILEDCIDIIKERIDYLKVHSNTRKFQINIIDEFLKKPMLHIPKKYLDEELFNNIKSNFPPNEMIDEEKKKSYTFIFNTLEDRDKGKEILNELGIHFTAGKTLVPFRLSGNVPWGVKVPEKENLRDLTFWVWPESLWAPISFLQTYLEKNGIDKNDWKEWWNGENSLVYQFIGEDNIYFYSIAQTGMFQKLDIKISHIIPNRHILFMDTKASSSSEIKPPMADELLEHYTVDQLRMHFLALGLSSKSTGFKPQVFMKEKEGDDVVLKEGNLLANVFNRLIRSCFYTVQTYYDGKIPAGKISDKIKDLAQKKVIEYEKHMYNHEFHRISYVIDEYIREVNKYWSGQIRLSEKNNDVELRTQTLIDAFYSCKVMSILIHPIAPKGCEMFAEYLNINNKIWDWEYIFEPLEYYVENLATHKLKFLEPRVDFFSKLESQYIK
ncbi:methionine--tRNA ligase [Candidatus Epulonipiscium fishelsonii]|uniref:Methionine--tRNA ligase n=1 Tax=Candidatus Epulonipiscium fishelsonii TaxID=77094 RepID=A0ACC8XF21_9FIRM|nr:methionine--tRNA ligase [Epulopiscium sp. SCG-B11WGA-EpuloA1]